MRVGIVGTGEVGRRVAKLLATDESVSAVVLVSGLAKTRSRLRGALGPKIESTDDGQPLLDARLDVVVLCNPEEEQLAVTWQALAAGAHVISLADSVATVAGILGLEDFAREVGRSIVVGAGASPGLSTLLARHAADLFEEIDEVTIGVVGTGGPACVERRSRAVRTDTQEWRDDQWVDCAARSGSELIWFPDPLGGVDCARGDLSEALLLRRVLPSAPSISAKVGRPAGRPNRFRRDTGAGAEPGAVRVSVSGRIDGVPDTVVYGVAAPAAVVKTAQHMCHLLSH